MEGTKSIVSASLFRVAIAWEGYFSRFEEKMNQGFFHVLRNYGRQWALAGQA